MDDIAKASMNGHQDREKVKEKQVADEQALHDEEARDGSPHCIRCTHLDETITSAETWMSNVVFPHSLCPAPQACHSANDAHSPPPLRHDVTRQTIKPTCRISPPCIAIDTPLHIHSTLVSFTQPILQPPHPNTSCPTKISPSRTPSPSPSRPSAT